MRGTSILVTLLAVAVLAPSATTAAAGPGISADKVCATTDGPRKQVVGLLPGTSNGIVGTRALYPGTQIYVAYCEGEDAVDPLRGKAWELATDPAIENVTEIGEYYRVRLTDAADRVVFSSLVEGRQPEGGLVVTVPGPTTVTSKVANTTVTFRSERAETYRKREAKFLSELRTLHSVIERLNETAKKLASGNSSFDQQTSRAMHDTLARLNSTLQRVENRGDGAQSLLFARRASERLPPSKASLTVMQAIERRQTSARNRAIAAVERYRRALDAVEARARRAIRTQFGAGALVGLLVGGVAGAYLPWRRGSEEADFRDHGSAEYDRSVLRIPIAVGIVLLGLGIALAAHFGVVGAIL